MFFSFLWLKQMSHAIFAVFMTVLHYLRLFTKPFATKQLINHFSINVISYFSFCLLVCPKKFTQGFIEL